MNTNPIVKYRQTKFFLIHYFVKALYVVGLCTIGFFQTQNSVYLYNPSYGPMLPEYLILNYLLLFALFFLVSFPFKKLSTGGIIFSILTFLLSVVNFYTLMFHGSIFTFTELANTKTALNVINQYDFFSFQILKKIWKLPLFFSVSLILSYIESKILPTDKNKKNCTTRSILLLLSSALIFTLFQTSFITSYMAEINRSWNQSISTMQYGYLLTLYSSTGKFELSKPEGYDPSVINSKPIFPETSPSSNTPDIFLVLNESFYDLQHVTELKTDIDPFASFQNIPGAVYGHSVSRPGGGTNSTEFELLTSIPQSLVASTPFNVLDMTSIPNMVSLLEVQGYYSLGSHTETGQNYNRFNAYDQVGFDEVHFIDDFTWEMYGSRWRVPDQCAYEQVIHWYESAQKLGKPIFAYCLTCQNHGGWNHNSPEENLIHVADYTGSVDENQVNEYLSCMKLSSDAFAWLCDYFRKADRPVIVCMIGDHSPSFIDEITTRDLGSREMIEQSSTPFVLWANYDLGISQTDIGYISATAVGPLLLKAAGVQYSPFYQYILNLSKEYPVITGWGEYMDSEGNVRTYTDHTPDTKEIWDYFYLSYNNLLSESENDWFSLPPSR